jgi:hypothetical protein
MLSLIPSDNSERIARISMKGNIINGKYIYLNNQDFDYSSKSPRIKLPKGAKLVPLPKKNFIERIYVTAPSNAGKSTFVGNYLSEYKKKHRDDDIFVFSAVDQDEPLDKHDPIRIPLDESILDEPLNINDFVNSLIVFDDTDVVQNKHIRNAVAGFRDFLLENGRHANIRMLVTSHIMNNYRLTTRVLNESTAIVFFPRHASPHHIKKWLKERGGVNRKQIKEILNLPSRWVIFYKTYPKYVLYEKGAFMIDMDEDNL